METLGKLRIFAKLENSVEQFVFYKAAFFGTCFRLSESFRLME